ncbi:MAG: OmpA family protein, partial [Planctomycetes bacterium]|nr:OmpA family protein [Planctomycetota bacterium]
SEGALLRENRELRDRVLAQQEALNDASLRVATLEAENLRLGAGGAGGTGFGDMTGVTTSRNAQGEVVVAIAGDVLFSSGKVEIRPGARKTLEQIARVLNSTYAANGIRVEGYTDTDPIKKSKWGTNERLSAERAMAVEDYLVKKGVKNARIYSAAFGTAKTRPSKEASRRVEIVILASAT